MLQRHAMVRIVKIDRLIRAGRHPNVKRLAEELEVDRRTVERDIEALRDQFQAPLFYSHEKGGYYYADNGFVLPTFKLTEGEVLSIILGQKLLSSYAGTPFEHLVTAALEKLSASLPAEITVNLEQLEQSISFDVEPTRGEPERIRQYYQEFIRMIREKKTAVLDYHSLSSNADTRRQIDPYHLLLHGGAWYVIAYCHLRKEVRTFAVDRISSLSATDDSFTPARGFSVSEFLGDSFGIEVGSQVEQVSIRFDHDQGRYVRERNWHASQRIEDCDDGSLVLHINVSGLGEVKRWVLGYGRHAEVLAPEWLRREIDDEVAAMSVRTANAAGGR